MSITKTLANLVYAYIAQRGVVSRAELIKEFSMPSSTMTRLLEEMLEASKLREHGRGSSTGGRRPILYETNPTYGYLFGLEISRIYSSIGLYDMHMNRLSAIRWKMDESMTPEVFLNRVQEAVRQFTKEHGLQPSSILGMGVGAVGPLDRERGLILDPVYFPARGWRNLPICGLLEERLQFPVLLDNGANTALVGEHWALRSERYQHMLYVHVGAGLRSAVMSNGQLVYGATDMEGAIGRMIIQAGELSRPGSAVDGALESFVSVHAIENEMRRLALAGALPQGRELRDSGSGNGEIWRFEKLLHALSAGDIMVQEKFKQAAAYLGIGLANLINVLHPEKVILGGALLNAHESVFETAVEVARSHTYYYPQYKPLFSKGLLKEEAVAAGAAVMVLKQLP
ncbi:MULTISPECIES: ROK family protein [unclassified Paenibacillus]|uniref:ROK family protein n=1 Tax=unclassified Paenibacillus TaxID=185978 RepID=UPI001044B38E|nr:MULTISPECIES: ROK family protein [unclassified Paenibacillus]NIK71191.1 putative NBD/HSP70 family sugar kinase [Paenibacillus sp. BK720]TCM97088.1 putative NBD/HSP70 family sugar kinase [Paenibacillus sp. BK033]